MNFEWLIPEVTSETEAKQVLLMLGACPLCGGVGWISMGATPPEQLQCDVCYSSDALFWLDGLEYYDRRRHLSDDMLNSTRAAKGLTVEYGYFKWNRHLKRD